MVPQKHRQPLSVTIAMEADKLHHPGEDKANTGDDGGEEDTGYDPRHENEDLISRSQDAIDAIKHNDPQAFNTAMLNWAKHYDANEPEEAPGEFGHEQEGEEPDEK